MIKEIRDKYLFNKTQIVILDKFGNIETSDDSIVTLQKHTSIAAFHPFFETILFLLNSDSQELTFNCVHIDTDSEKKSIDVLFNSGNETSNPFLIFYDFTDHYNNFQSIAQEKNESVLSFHLSELKAKQLESEKEFKNKFLANITHDLRTPISASLWFVNMLEKQETQESKKEIIALLCDTINIVKGLVDDVLDLSKIEMQKIVLHNEPFDFLKTINHIEKIVTPKAIKKGLAFSVNKNHNFPQFVIGDKLRVTQILINLLDNAIKFTKKGNVALSFDVLQTENNSVTIQIQVADTGTGIKSVNKEDVFQSFKKMHTSSKIDGSGLGLSIVSSLLQLMNGTISYESKLKVGTTFTVTIPFLLSSNAKTAKSKFIPLVIKNPKKVLIVEDDKINQLLLKKLLSDHKGFTVEFANNGKEALQIIEKQSFDLILIDREMPHLDGISTAKKIRKSKNDAVNSLPIILVSGYENDQDQAIFNGSLTKPINKEKLFKEIYSVLKLK